MKVLLAAIIFTVSFIPSLYAHMEVESVDDIMNRMVLDQNVSRASEIDCDNVADHDFEELGDSVMERMIGDSELHEQMDNMMGGEGSESLEQMHMVMGKNWLGCDGFEGMMGYGMMPMMMRMMGNYYPGYYSSYNVLITFNIIGWFLAISLAIALILIFAGKIKVRRR